MKALPRALCPSSLLAGVKKQSKALPLQESTSPLLINCDAWEGKRAPPASPGTQGTVSGTHTILRRAFHHGPVYTWYPKVLKFKNALPFNIIVENTVHYCTTTTTWSCVSSYQSNFQALLTGSPFPSHPSNNVTLNILPKDSSWGPMQILLLTYSKNLGQFLNAHQKANQVQWFVPAVWPPVIAAMAVYE